MEWGRRLGALLDSMGFRVVSGSVKYRSLAGGIVTEERVVGYQRNVKVVVARVGGGFRVSIVVHDADEGLAEYLEELGASADYASGRVDAVYYAGRLEGVERFLRRALG